jgi:hypothetical protein
MYKYKLLTPGEAKPSVNNRINDPKTNDVPIELTPNNLSLKKI